MISLPEFIFILSSSIFETFYLFSGLKTTESANKRHTYDTDQTDFRGYEIRAYPCNPCSI